jgi:hypothetical protein
MARYRVAVDIDTDGPLLDEHRAALEANVWLAVTEPADEDGDTLAGYGATVLGEVGVVELGPPSGGASLPSMTVRELRHALFLIEDQDLPVTIQTDTWWLNVAGVEAPTDDEPLSVQVQTRDDFDTRQF